MSKDARELIVDIMKEQNISNAQLGKRIGVKNTAIWDRLNSSKTKSLKVDTVIQMLNALDYKLIAIPSNKDTPKGGVELK